MIRLTILMIPLLGLSACGQEPVERSPHQGSAGQKTSSTQLETGGPALDRTGAQPPRSSAQAAQAASPGQASPPDPLDRTLDDLPPIRTGPMAATSIGPWNDELAAERQAQLNLPRADGPLWETLRQTRIAIDERSQLFTASHPAPVRAIAGRRVTVRGYMLPLEAAARTGHFLISPYTPVCFFHPPAEPNEVIEVRLSRPIEAGYHLVEVTGVLQLANDGEKGLFFVIPEGAARIIERIFA
ncbi:DUF3299 domain-containing protein [Brevundimonas sp.]|uniref:DUF3299 domain-containing protein n=1 Tax=Brevundimonas sp. TaxID=1871086 RepID=UPI002D5F5D9E|nr:DUF3299 domain-containing protein [Brevundimonas sp.]HYC73825.1 DUF3299 domain-containing protein [Brevundimonas sp.]